MCCFKRRLLSCRMPHTSLRPEWSVLTSSKRLYVPHNFNRERVSPTPCCCKIISATEIYLGSDITAGYDVFGRSRTAVLLRCSFCLAFWQRYQLCELKYKLLSIKSPKQTKLSGAKWQGTKHCSNTDWLLLLPRLHHSPDLTQSYRFVYLSSIKTEVRGCLRTHHYSANCMTSMSPQSH